MRGRRSSLKSLTPEPSTSRRQRRSVGTEPATLKMSWMSVREVELMAISAEPVQVALPERPIETPTSEEPPYVRMMAAMLEVMENCLRLDPSAESDPKAVDVEPSEKVVR